MDTPLAALSQSLSALAAACGPSLVRVEARRRRPATGLAWSAEGLVLTAAHVVEQEEALGVALHDGRTLGARLVGRDGSTDLALLRTETPHGLAPLPHAPLDGVQVGQLGLVLARPGRTVRATLGLVSAKGGEWRAGHGGRVEAYVETDADLPPGFSGGALVDAQGRLVGLPTRGLVRGSAVVLPAVTLARVAAALEAHGRIARGYLGVSAYPVRLDADVARAHGGQPSGLILLGVEPGGPAHAAGLRQGDVLVTADGEPLGDMEALFTLLSEDSPGRALQLRALRAGEAREVPVTVGRRP